MGLLAPVLAADPMDDRYYPGASFGRTGGLPVTDDEAMSVPAFYAGVSYIAEDTAKVPLNMFQDVEISADRYATRRARDHELQPLLHDQPNRYQDALMYREMVVALAILRGRCVSEIVTGDPISYAGAPTRSGAVDQLVPLHPDLLRRERSRTTGEWVYFYLDPKRDFAERRLLSDDLFIVSGRHDRSVLDYAATNLRAAIDADRFAALLFRRGARHQGVIQAKGRLQDAVKSALRHALDEYAIDGPRAGRPLLLEDGMEWKQIGMTAQDARLLETQQFSVAQVCRWLRISPHKVFDLSGNTNASIEKQLATDYVVDSILGWCERVEQAIWRQLIVDKTFFAKHNLDGLMRGDPETRGRMYALAIQWGWMSRNEVREREDLNPMDGLDDPLTPTNMTTNPDGSASVEYAPQGRLAAPATAEETGLLRLFAADAAARAVRREVAAVEKLAERAAGDEAAFRAGVTAFYTDALAERIADEIHIPEHVARRYAADNRAALLAGGAGVISDWLTERVGYLASKAVEPEVATAA